MSNEEYTIIVEYSFNPRQQSFVVRFLNGESYSLKITDLPKKMLTKKPVWDSTHLNDSKTALIYNAGEEMRQIMFHVIHSRGKKL